MLKLLIHLACALLPYADIRPVKSIPIEIGGAMDTNNCLISAGFTWCESSQDCIRQWETPCADNYNDCSDCLRRQINGENIACPMECDNAVIDCIDDTDCGDSHFCRPVMRNNEVKECYQYSNEGDTCGGYTLSMYESRCHPTLDCVHTKMNYRPSTPIRADSPGRCMRKCNLDGVRNEYGTCIIRFDERH
jgi:hypothetical protein